MLYLLIKWLEGWLAGTWFEPLVQVFLVQTSFRAISATIFAFLLVVLLGKPTIRWLLRMKIGDNPEFYHADLNRLMRNKAETPTMGGVLIAGAIAVSILLLADITEYYVIMALICLVLYSGLGVIDDYLKLTSAQRNPGDREGLKVWEKLVLQIGWALVLGFFIHNHGEVTYKAALSNGLITPETPNVSHTLNLPFQRTWMPGADGEPIINPNLIQLGAWSFGILTVLVISGSSNATNLTDGMDGLLSGIMAVVSFAFLILCLISGNDSWAKTLLLPHVPSAAELAIVAGAMTGACIGFLWYNCHPAQVFMGDTGSLPLGAMLGYIAVVIRQEILLVLIGGILVLEVLSVALQIGYFKLSGGSRLFRCAPIHHHFHLSGWSEQQVVVRFWLITALLAAVALATIKLR